MAGSQMRHHRDIAKLNLVAVMNDLVGANRRKVRLAIAAEIAGPTVGEHLGVFSHHHHLRPGPLLELGERRDMVAVRVGLNDLPHPSW